MKAKKGRLKILTDLLKHAAKTMKGFVNSEHDVPVLFTFSRTAVKTRKLEGAVIVKTSNFLEKKIVIQNKIFGVLGVKAVPYHTKVILMPCSK